MENIEVRIWSPKANKFFYNGGALDCLIQQNNFNNKENELGYDHISDGIIFELCSGIKDINEENIFEGDHVKFDTDKIGVVHFCNACFYLKVKKEGVSWTTAYPLCNHFEENLERIGNIHEEKK